jgi:hypothetical protein
MARAGVSAGLACEVFIAELNTTHVMDISRISSRYLPALIFSTSSVSFRILLRVRDNKGRHGNVGFTTMAPIDDTLSPSKAARSPHAPLHRLRRVLHDADVAADRGVRLRLMVLHQLVQAPVQGREARRTRYGGGKCRVR